jgi:hypothetical protein
LRGGKQLPKRADDILLGFRNYASLAEPERRRAVGGLRNMGRAAAIEEMHQSYLRVLTGDAGDASFEIRAIDS